MEKQYSAEPYGLAVLQLMETEQPVDKKKLLIYLKIIQNFVVILMLK